MLGATPIGAIEIGPDPLEQRCPTCAHFVRDSIALDLVADVVDEPCEGVDGEQVAAGAAREEQRRDSEVLPRRLRGDLGEGRKLCGLRHSPSTWMNTFRGRDRSSSQKKMR